MINKRISLLIISLLMVQLVYSQVNYYSFQQSSSGYVPISGGTVLGTASTATGATALDNIIYTLPAATIPFDFRFNGSAFTGCYVSTNGFIVFGTTIPSTTNFTPISGTAGYTGAISAFGRDMIGVFDAASSTAAEVSYSNIGSSPNRKFVIQWKNFKPSTQTGVTALCNFQIRLCEGTHEIEIAYNFTGTGFTSATAQVGLRGSANTNFNTRSVVAATGVWGSSTLGAANNTTCSISSTQLPTNLLYSFSCSPPSGGSYTYSTTNSAKLIWNGNGPGTFEIEYGANGFTQGTGTTVTSSDTFKLITGLSPSTTYQYYIRKTCSASGKVGPITFKTGAAGEDCSTATSLNVSGSLATCNYTTINSGISTNAPAAYCSDVFGAVGSNDAWAKFTVPSNNQNKITIKTLAGTYNDWIVEVWSGCPDSLGSHTIDCMDDANDLNTMPTISICQNVLTPGNTYYLRAWPYLPVNANMSVCVMKDSFCIIPPVNDNCVDATVIPINPIGGCPGANQQFSNQFASPTVGAAATIACDANIVNDVWFVFNTANIGTFKVTMNKLSALSLKAAVIFDCDGNQEACFNPADGTHIVSGLNPYADYYLRVWTNPGEEGTFTICLEDLCDDATADLSGSTTICEGNTGQLKVDFTGIPPWTFVYNDGILDHQVVTSTTPYFIPVSPTSTTSYTPVSVASQYCTGEVTGSANFFVLSKPILSFPLISPICLGQSITLTGGSPSGGTYSGVGVNGNIFNSTTAGVGSHTITYSYTNNSGCTNTITQVIVVNANPIVGSFIPTSGSVGTIVTINGSGFSNASNVLFNGVAATSITFINSNQIQATVPSSAASGFITVQNGSCTNVSSSVFTVIINTVAANCKSATLYLDNSGNATLNASQVNNNSTATAGIASVTVSPSNFSCNNIGVNAVTLVVTDVLGNSSSCTSNVNVLDTIKPIANCKNAVVYLNSSGSGTLLPSQVNNGSNDNCSIASLVLSKLNFSYADTGSPSSVVLSVYDVSGQMSNCNALVTVIDTFPHSVQLNVKVFIQGFYIGNGKMVPVLNPADTSVCDSIIIAIASSSSPYDIIYSTSGLLMTDGNVNVSIPAMFVGSQYYLVVQHRNSISVWSKDPITISGTGPITYDFTSAPGAMKIMKTLGRNHKALKNN
jgi:hypothetical protein